MVRCKHTKLVITNLYYKLEHRFDFVNILALLCVSMQVSWAGIFSADTELHLLTPTEIETTTCPKYNKIRQRNIHCLTQKQISTA